MNADIIVALIGLFGSAIGSVVGIMASARLTTYRIEQLEKKVSKHNNLIERTYEVEKNIRVIEEHFSTIDRRIDELEKGE
jgi:hypothetical protein